MKEINFRLGLFRGDIFEGFVLGNLITIEKKIEYEILLLYVKIQKRKLGYATKFLKSISLVFNNNQLKNIYLKVAKDNQLAINLYKKNNYLQTGIRKDDYQFSNTKIDVYFIEKIINE